MHNDLEAVTTILKSYLIVLSAHKCSAQNLCNFEITHMYINSEMWCTSRVNGQDWSHFLTHIALLATLSLLLLSNPICPILKNNVDCALLRTYIVES